MYVMINNGSTNNNNIETGLSNNSKSNDVVTIRAINEIMSKVIIVKITPTKQKVISLSCLNIRGTMYPIVGACC